MNLRKFNKFKFIVGSYIDKDGFSSLILFLLYNNQIVPVDSKTYEIRNILKILGINSINYVFFLKDLRNRSPGFQTNLNPLLKNEQVLVSSLKPKFYYYFTLSDERFTSLKEFFNYAKQNNIEGYDAKFFSSHNVYELMELKNIPRVKFNDVIKGDVKFIAWWFNNFLKSILIGEEPHSLETFSFDDLAYCSLLLEDFNIIRNIRKTLNLLNFLV